MSTRRTDDVSWACRRCVVKVSQGVAQRSTATRPRHTLDSLFTPPHTHDGPTDAGSQRVVVLSYHDSPTTRQRRCVTNASLPMRHSDDAPTTRGAMRRCQCVVVTTHPRRAGDAASRRVVVPSYHDPSTTCQRQWVVNASWRRRNHGASMTYQRQWVASASWTTTRHDASTTRHDAGVVATTRPRCTRDAPPTRRQKNLFYWCLVCR